MKRQYLKQSFKASLIGFYVLLSMAVGAQNHTSDQQKRQGPPPLPTEEQLEKRIAKLSTELNLSEKQVQQLSELFTAHFNELKAKREHDNTVRQKHRQEMEAHRKKFEEEVKSVLTPEQKIKFDQLRKEKKPRYSQGKE